MSKKVKVSKIVLEVGEKKIELSLEEARELEGLLHDIFSGKVEHHFHSYPVYGRPFYPCYPTWVVTSGFSQPTDATYTISNKTDARFSNFALADVVSSKGIG